MPPDAVVIENPPPAEGSPAAGSRAPQRPRRSPLLGILALLLAAAALLNLFLPLLGPVVVVLALTLGVVAIVGRQGRWWGVGAIALSLVLVGATVASLFFGTTINVREQALIDRATSMPPPAGFELADAPTGTGFCGYLQVTCAKAEVLWSYRATQEGSDPTAMCAPFLAWAADEGITEVFPVSDLEWDTWYVQEIVDGLKAGGRQVYPVDSAEAADACATMVSSPRSADGVLADAQNLIGATRNDGTGGEVLVARIGEARSLPDGNPLEDGTRPFEILGALISV